MNQGRQRRLRMDGVHSEQSVLAGGALRPCKPKGVALNKILTYKLGPGFCGKVRHHGANS